MTLRNLGLALCTSAVFAGAALGQDIAPALVEEPQGFNLAVCVEAERQVFATR